MTRFVGREQERQSLVEAVAGHRLVTLSGAGGVGKSRLVSEAMPELEAGFDRVLVVDLEGAEPADPEAISALLGAASPEALVLEVGDRSTLLVLDGCERVLGPVAAFAGPIIGASDSISVLVTSRAPLALMDEQLVLLDPLPLPLVTDPALVDAPAVALFLDRASAAGARLDGSPDTLAAVAALCRRIDAVPLAIELAAARTRSSTPAELLGLLDERLEVLRSQGRDRPARHRSVRSTLELSVQLLDEPARRLVRRLGVFSAPFDLDVALAVGGADGDDRVSMLERIDELIDSSLLVSEVSGPVTRYRMLELVRAFARQELRANGEWDDANERLTDVMAAAADDLVAAGMQQWTGDLMTRIATSAADLISAIDWCLGHDRTPIRAFRLYAPLFAAVHQSLSGQVRAAGDRLLERWPDAAAPQGAEVVGTVATAHAIGGSVERADALARGIIDLPTSEGPSVVARVIAHRALGLAALRQDDLATAATQFATTSALAAEALPPFGREAQAFEATLLDRLGRSDEGLACAESATIASQAANDPITELFALLVSANISARAGRWDDASRAVQRGQVVAAPLESRWWRATVFRSRALLVAYDAAVATMTDGWAAAVERWRGALDAAAARGEVAEVALTSRAAAGAAAAVGESSLAADLAALVPVSSELFVFPDLFPAVDAVPPSDRAPSELVRQALVLLSPPPATEPPMPAIEARLVRDGDGWTMSFRGRDARLRDLKGIGVVAALVSRPGEEVHCLELLGGADVSGSAGPVIDDRARTEYQRQVADLQTEIDDAVACNDLGRAEKAEADLDQLVEQLRSAFGIGGRDRTVGSSTERARNAVGYRVRSALKRVDEVHPELARHLRNAVRLGTWCSYRPDQPVVWHTTPV